MRRYALAWTWLVIVGVGCWDGQGGPGTGSAGAGGNAGTIGGAGTTGAAGTTGGGGASTSDGAGTSGSAGTSGNAGTSGSAGASGNAGTSGGAGTSGSAGTSGDAGTSGSAGTGGSAGSIGGGGTGGSTGTGGSSGGGSTGTGGVSGSGGASGGGVGGTGGTGGGLRVTSARAFPNVQITSMLVAVDNQDTAIAVGPSGRSESTDPGPRIDWIPLQGAARSTTFPNAVTPEAIGVDGSRSLWLAGQLYRTVSFGGGVTLQPVDAGYYLVRLNADGSHGSSRAVTRPASPWVRRVLADPLGNIYVVGGIYSVGSPLTQSVFVTKFSPEGVEIYNREFPSQDTSAYANDVAVANGEVFIIGTYNAPLQFGTTTLTLPSTSIDSGFIAVLDADTGAPKRAMRFGGPDFDVGNSIEVTSAGTLRIAGLLSGVATVGGLQVLAAAMGSPFVAELTTAGAGSWVRLVEGTGIVFAADTNAADRTFAVGYVNGTIKGTFVADVNTGGVLTLPLRATIADGSNGGMAVAADRHGGVWVAGDFQGNVNFGSSPLDAGGASMFGNFLIHLEP